VCRLYGQEPSIRLKKSFGVAISNENHSDFGSFGTAVVWCGAVWCVWCGCFSVL